MAGHIVFEGVSITNIINDISIKFPKNYKTNGFIGGNGSHTKFVSQLGRIISFKSICPSYEEVESPKPPITIYRELSENYKAKTGVLTSESHIDLKGNYLCTGFEVIEDTGNNFTISWEFTEVIPFNTVNQTFRVWGSASNKKTTKKQQTTAKTSGNKLNKTSKYLLESCSTLSPSNKVRKCVKYLQKFLQSIGYYKNHKVDGIYGNGTKSAVKRVQKVKKLKQTGNWDKATLNYFQRKYYPEAMKDADKMKKAKK